MKRIVWLASYPKSGNTWVRVLLSNVLKPSACGANINHLEITGIASSREMFDETLEIESSLLSDDMVDVLRPAAYRAIAARANGPVYMKVHDAFSANSDGGPLFPSDASLRAVCIVRDPLDVAVSFASHMGWTSDRAVDFMCDPGAVLSAGNSGSVYLRERICSWSENVRSWIGCRSMPVHVMRYEDLHLDPAGSLESLLEFLNIPASEEIRRNAVSCSVFSRLQAQERRDGFTEKPASAAVFFRAGRSGTGRRELSGKQVDRLESEHGEWMRRLGYPVRRSGDK